LRVGEVKALRWREDVDMVAKTVTVTGRCGGQPDGNGAQSDARRLKLVGA